MGILDLRIGKPKITKKQDIQISAPQPVAAAVPSVQLQDAQVDSGLGGLMSAVDGEDGEFSNALHDFFMSYSKKKAEKKPDAPVPQPVPKERMKTDVELWQQLQPGFVEGKHFGRYGGQTLTPKEFDLFDDNGWTFVATDGIYYHFKRKVAKLTKG